MASINGVPGGVVSFCLFCGCVSDSVSIAMGGIVHCLCGCLNGTRAQASCAWLTIKPVVSPPPTQSAS